MKTLIHCLLCNEKHSVNFHVYVKRTIKIAHHTVLTIYVVRLFCPVHYQKRKETGNPLQYTITVLPAFLIPHSRIPVKSVQKAVESYNSSSNPQHAAMLMNCENIKSFMRYYNRARQKIKQWRLFLLQLLSTIIMEISSVKLENTKTTPQSFTNEWEIFYQQLKDYYQHYEKLPDSGKCNITDHFMLMHAIFTRNNLGLGP